MGYSFNKNKKMRMSRIKITSQKNNKWVNQMSEIKLDEDKLKLKQKKRKRKKEKKHPNIT